MTHWLFDDANDAPDSAPVILLAHGAGVGYDTPFMERLAWSLSVNGVSVTRFEFPYMQKRREDGRKRPPDRQPLLLEHFESMVRQCRRDIGDQRTLVVAGKSMGGRMASLLAATPGLLEQIQGVVCFGYPFHPPGKPDQWRTGHFPEVAVPMAIFQGTRDPFGKPNELADHGPLPAHVRLQWLDGGNHDLRPLKKQGLGADALIDESARRAAAFVRSLG
ncbi:alpha/beta family hydrolase [Marinobacter sp. M1N3S26]|uniref:alpha/beta family hydrolase n=1 Tax=Marinobacter sp. M1N3S26 TaxID=3382299 RepID=UPI00387B31AA